MHGLMHYSVLVSGLQGPGVEAAKNTILAGPARVTLHDPAPCQLRDMSSNFYINETHVSGGVSRADACVAELTALNSLVAVSVLATASDDEDAGAGIPKSAVAAHSCVMAVNKPLPELIKLNESCREAGTHLIAVNARGLFGSVFVDLGPSFQTSDPDGENPRDGVLVSLGPLATLAAGESDGATAERVVESDPGRNHDLSDGDLVSFELIEGACGEALNGADGRFAVRVVDRNTFAVRLPAVVSPSASAPAVPDVDFVRGGHWKQHKRPKDITFRPIGELLGAEAIKAGLPAVMNFLHMERPQQLHALSQALDASENPAAPMAEAEAAAIVAKAETELLSEPLSEEDRAVLTTLAGVSSGDLSPIASVLGGIAGQEVLKAGGRKFTPLEQMVFVDAASALPALPSVEERTGEGSRYDGQIAVFGRRAQRRLGAAKTFIVGAGALGCEFLKGFALMGVGCDGGQVVVTDMDSIERSNLNRQFLFRPKDVGRAKSIAAAEAATAMNPNIKSSLRVLELKVAAETADTFSAGFWSNLDFVTNALDNVQARKHVDSLCVEHGLPLLESGTLGTKCNTMTVIPHVTLSYSSTEDAPDESVPVCTLKSFPYLIEHTLQWARDAFEANFVLDPQEAQTYLAAVAGASGSGGAAASAATPGRDAYTSLIACNRDEMLQRAEKAHRVLTGRSATWEECVRWARVEFERLLVWPIHDLLRQHPADKMVEGKPFWTATKRPPTPGAFTLEDPLHERFVAASASLRARVCGVTTMPDAAQVSTEALRAALSSFEVPAWVPSTATIAANDDEAAAQAKAAQERVASADVETETARLVNELPLPEELGADVAAAMGPDPFEKDDDSNSHIAFISATGNLRARQYGIPTVDEFKVKGIVGRIIPAIATTTAMTTGFVCLELYKLVRPSEDPAVDPTLPAPPLPLEAFMDGNHNLAVNQFALFEPDPCPVMRWAKGAEFQEGDDIGRCGDTTEEGTPYTLWSWVTLRASEGVTSVQAVVDWYEERGMTVDGITLMEAEAKVSLFNGFDDDDASLPFGEHYASITGSPLPADKSYVKLLVFLEDEDEDDDDEDDEDKEGEDDNDAGCPPVKLILDV
jgi:ubiquitin-activating enzyme E1